MAKTTYCLPKALTDKLNDYTYWKRTTSSVLIAELLINFFADRKVKPKPKSESLAEKARAKGGKKNPRPGRRLTDEVIEAHGGWPVAFV